MGFAALHTSTACLPSTLTRCATSRGPRPQHPNTPTRLTTWTNGRSAAIASFCWLCVWLGPDCWAGLRCRLHHARRVKQHQRPHRFTLTAEPWRCCTWPRKAGATTRWAASRHECIHMRDGQTRHVWTHRHSHCDTSRSVHAILHFEVCSC